MIVVEDQPNSLPAEIADLEEVVIFMTHFNMPDLTRFAKEFEANCAAAGGSVADCKETIWADGPVSGVARNMVLINGLYQPSIAMAANRWYRWRVVFSAFGAILDVSAVGCEMKLLAKDGIYVSPAPRDITTGKMYIGPGNRADWVVSCPAGTYDLTASPRGGTGALSQKLASLVVTDQGDTPCQLPTFRVNRPVRGCTFTCSPVAARAHEGMHVGAWALVLL